jgi:Cof subfamily protein (haloacid dehalogenase superfamily)
MKRSFRLAAIDLDDTLLGPDHSISPKNYAAVQAMKAAGVQTVIASGRMHDSTAPYADQLGLEGPIVSYNGALVKTRGTGEILHHVTVPADLAAEITEYAEAHDLPLNYYLDDRLRVKERTSWSDLYYSRTMSEIHVVGSLRQYDGQSPTKLIILGVPEKVREWSTFFRERYGDRLNILITNVEYLEFVAPGVSKAFGLATVGERMGIAAEEMIAFGDSGNDREMLEYAGCGVAMGNAREEIKAVANYIAPRSDEDGFAMAVEALMNL